MLTIDGNSNALGQSEAVLANKSRNLAKTAGSQVLSGRLAVLNLTDVELEVVGLGNRPDGDGARVFLRIERWKVSKGTLCNGKRQRGKKHTATVKRVPKAILNNEPCADRRHEN